MVVGDALNQYLSELLPALQASSGDFECKTLAEVTPVVDVMMRLSLEALRQGTLIPKPMFNVLMEMNSRISIQWSQLPDDEQETVKLNVEEAKNNIVVCGEG